MVDVCQACFEKRTTKYYELAAAMFADKKIINWKVYLLVEQDRGDTNQSSQSNP